MKYFRLVFGTVVIAMAVFFTFFIIESVLSAPARGAEVQPTPAPEVNETFPAYVTGGTLLASCADHKPQCPAYVLGVLDALLLATDCADGASKSDMVEEMQALATILTHEKPEALANRNAASYVMQAFTYTKAAERCPKDSGI